jgi:hypothetical protein
MSTQQPNHALQRKPDLVTALDMTYSFLPNLVCAFHASENGCRLLRLTAFCD